MTTERYRRPGLFVRLVFNPLVALCLRLGISVWGARILVVRGRRSGVPRSIPVNVLTVEGVNYLVAPRGGTEWVRNLRVARTCHLRLGRRSRTHAAHELADVDKPAVLRAYLRRWGIEVGIFFDGLTADAPEADLAAAGHEHPVFRLDPG
ncbi:MAG: nitroreductase/quinone reductase family protein, partial [Actinomycetota bacterium]|nr:nitroreductase/quinone reductase family protein [Actinomycetota bacterium]